MPGSAGHPFFDVIGILSQHNTRWALSKYEENQIVYSQGDPADSDFLRSYRQGEGYGHFPAWKGSRRCNPGTGRVLRRRSDDWDAAAIGYNYHNVDMRNHKDRDENISRFAPPGP
jgi:hypothetical protein